MGGVCSAPQYEWGSPGAVFFGVLCAMGDFACDHVYDALFVCKDAAVFALAFVFGTACAEVPQRAFDIKWRNYTYEDQWKWEATTKMAHNLGSTFGMAGFLFAWTVCHPMLPVWSSVALLFVYVFCCGFFVASVYLLVFSSRMLWTRWLMSHHPTPPPQHPDQ
jgi:hypothetical protein